jgi:hypothetical protein
MKVGDIVEHVKTGDIALLTQLWSHGHNRGVIEVMHKGSLVRWFRTSTKVVDEV